MVFFRKNDTVTSDTGAPPPAAAEEFAELQQTIEQAMLPEPAAATARLELERLKKTDASLPEHPVIRNYLEFILALPWNRCSDDNLDIQRAQAILEAEHFGLGPVKERMLEFLAVQNLRSQQNFNVLVVDDEKIARANLSYVLAKEGYHVTAAANGMEALDTLQKNHFDLVLTDLKMDKMDGQQLLDAAKQLNDRIEVIMITGYATVGSAVEALRKGAAHYLAKPVNIDELRAVVRQVLDRKKLIQMSRSPVLCFAGPPGTGKTSIGHGIAQALGRKFVRLSLAGLRDEAELRGHRRTYVGALPGRILNELKRAGSRNPVFMLDEIDKIGQDFQGDAASVLLEILDPEQNAQFVDHYLDLPFDLSGVLFIATANVVERIPGPLRDRLEMIDFYGYTEREKLSIARRHLAPRQMAANSLEGRGIRFADEALLAIIRSHTQEAGVRNLERELATVCRKVARLCLQQPGNSALLSIDAPMVAKLLGPRKYDHETAASGHQAGVATGLVWSEFGGEIIFVEAGIMKGAQQLILTGSLGKILQESAQTALSYVRGHTDQFGIAADFFNGHDIHIHIPAGGVAKDGPSAGITIALALISLLSGRRCRPDAAMTGELSLSGRILPVQGLREKLLAAQRAGIKTVVVPRSNALDIDHLGPEITAELELILADDAAAVTEHILQPAAGMES